MEAHKEHNQGDDFCNCETEEAPAKQEQIPGKPNLVTWDTLIYIVQLPTFSGRTLQHIARSPIALDITHPLLIIHTARDGFITLFEHSSRLNPPIAVYVQQWQRLEVNELGDM